MPAEQVRHVLGLSGGKDSAALAIHLSRMDDYRYFVRLFKNSGLAHIAAQVEEVAAMPNIEYFFTDTGKELPEVYQFLDKLEAFLGQEIHRINAQCQTTMGATDTQAPFDHYLLAEHGGMLPSRRHRWCTLKMKIYPFERFIGGDEAVSYVGIRADEDRRARLSARQNIHAVYPFIADDLIRNDVFRILEDSIGIPDYYRWRSRSGCYFCFFQRKSEWLGLRREHPDLFRKAMQYENNTYDPATGRKYTWMGEMSLEDLDSHAENMAKSPNPNDTLGKSAITSRQNWIKNLIAEEDDDPEDQACAICSL